MYRLASCGVLLLGLLTGCGGGDVSGDPQGSPGPSGDAVHVHVVVADSVPAAAIAKATGDAP